MAIDERRGVFVNSDDLLDFGQTARLLGVAKTVVRKMTAAGKIPCIAMSNGDRRWLRQHLISYMAEQEWWSAHDSKVSASKMSQEANNETD